MIYFLIPVYNEEANITRLYTDTVKYMNAIGREDFAFIFVDDGSSDRSLEILNSFKSLDAEVNVLHHYPNQGVRITFLDGFRYFLKIASEGDILITKEADNTSDNNIISDMLSALCEENFDIALASCYAKGGGLESTTFLRMFLSKSANLIIKFRFALFGLSTFSSFFRAFKYEVIHKAFEQDTPPMTYDGFVCVVEMLIKLKRLDFKIKEIPMVLKSSERVGKSKMPVMKTIKGYIKLSLSGC